MGTPPGSAMPAAALETHAGAGRRRAPSASREAGARLEDVVSLRGRHVALEPRSISCGTILDLIPDAAMVVSGQGILLYANRAAQELLNSGCLGIGPARADRGGSDVGRSLSSALAEACSGSADAASAFIIDQPDGPPTVAAVIPCALFDGQPHALLLLPWPTSRNGSTVERLQRLFKLTRSEAEICEAIGEGLKLSEIAKARGVAVGTVRAQLKAGAAKLGCTRQTQIALLLRRIAVIGAAAPAGRPR